jgi:hypothetical protein
MPRILEKDQTMNDDAAAFALEGLEQGYRIIAKALNEAIPFDQAKIAAGPASGSMAEARFKMLRGAKMDPHEFPFPELLQPWSLGFIEASTPIGRNQTYVTIGNTDEFWEGAIAFLRSRSKEWTAEQWIENVRDPVESHFKQWKEFLSGKCKDPVDLEIDRLIDAVGAEFEYGN